MNRTAKNQKRGKVRYLTFSSYFERKAKEKQIASLKETDKVLNLLTFNINRAAFAAYQGATSLGWKYGIGYIHLRRFIQGVP